MRTWCRERWQPLTAAALLLLVGFDYVILWPGIRTGAFDVWLAPGDLWATYFGAVQLVHGHFVTIYATDPGSVLLFAPVGAVGHALGLEMGPNFTALAAPTGWMLAGPFDLLLSAIPLFAVDALARRWGFSSRRRLLLALAQGVLLWNVAVLWGHPEDAVAVGLLLYAVGAAQAGRWGRTGWLIGLAVVVQPFAVLAVPALATTAALRHGDGRVRPGDAWALVWRSFTPYVAALVPALVLAWGVTTKWLRNQPNYPEFNHPTPFTSWAAHVPHSLGGVSTAPGRLLGISVAVVLSVLVCRRRPVVDATTVWAVAASFTGWFALESVANSYFTWPALAIGVLLVARRSLPRFGFAVALGMFCTWFGNLRAEGLWTWWLVEVATLLVILALGWPGWAPRPDGPAPAEGELAAVKPATAEPRPIDTRADDEVAARPRVADGPRPTRSLAHQPEP